MVREKQAKIISLAIFAAVIIIYAAKGVVLDVGICAYADWSNRLLYHFFHASWLHTLLNGWCLLSVAFVYDISLGRILAAFVAASLFPVDSLYTLLHNTNLCVPTVGLSGVCYVLMGSLAFMVRNKLYYHSCLLLYIGIGFLFPNVNALLHLYCYTAGIMLGFLTNPIK